VPVMSMREAINTTLHEEMARDPDIIVLGEDVVGGMGTAGGPEAGGGVWGATRGLYAKFGSERVIDTPISEAAIIGAASGAALCGKRPIVELMFADFIGVCLDQLWNQLAKFRYMFGGKSVCPVVVRITYGAGLNAAAQHSQAPYAMMTAIPGLKVVVPSTPADAKGLLTTAIRDDDPVLVFEHKALYGLKGEVPSGTYAVPFACARNVRKGTSISIVACGQMVGVVEEAASRLELENITCDVIDIRTTSPLDEEAILDSVEATGHLIVVDEAPARCGLARDIAALVAEQAFASLRAPITVVTPPHTPVPFARELERAYLVSPVRICVAAHKVLGYL
jgi:acetoin:2,6-dichlorophenolindophenol oxidoreductase subunit beta